MKLEAIWRRDGETGRAQANQWGVRYLASPASLIEDAAVDLVIAVVPTAVNHSIGLAAAGAKKPTLLEKPLAKNTSEGEEICAAFERVGSRLGCAQTLRMDPLVEKIAELLPTLGALMGFDLEQRIEPRGLAWEEQPAVSGGGVLIQTAIHSVDALRVVAGFPAVEVVSAVTGRVVYAANEDHGIVNLAVTGERTHGNTIIGTVSASKVGESRHMRHAYFCERGGLEADFIQRQIRLRKGSKTELIDIPAVPTVVRMLEGVALALETGGEMPVTGRDALETLKIVDAAYAKAALIHSPA